MVELKSAHHHHCLAIWLNIFVLFFTRSAMSLVREMKISYSNISPLRQCRWCVSCANTHLIKNPLLKIIGNLFGKGIETKTVENKQ